MDEKREKREGIVSMREQARTGKNKQVERRCAHVKSKGPPRLVCNRLSIQLL
jgi:hypothetical protein